MDDRSLSCSAQLVAESVFTTLESTGWERPRTRWIVAEIPGRSDARHGIEAFRTYEVDLGGAEPDDGLVGRRAGPEVVGMAIAGAMVPERGRRSPPLRTVLAADRNGRWFRVAAGPGGRPMRNELAWFDGPGSGARCYLGAPWLGPPPPAPHEVFARWWISSLLVEWRGNGLAAIDEFAAGQSGLTTLELADGWVPRVPMGWTWEETRTVWASCALGRGDEDLARLVRWADGAELAARVRRATPVIDPDWLGVAVGELGAGPAAGLLRALGFTFEAG